MIKTCCAIFFLFLTAAAFSQTGSDTTAKLIAQKNNIITSNTIVQIENLGEMVNTENPEMRPTISADGNQLFFIRQNDPKNVNYQTVPNSQDIWFSIKDTATGKWGKAKHLSRAINGAQYNAVYWVSADLNTLLLKGAYVDGQYLGVGLSMLHKVKENEWTAPEMLKIRNFNKYSNTAQLGASMGNDGQTLLFYMTEKKDDYNNNLFVSFLEGNDIWTAPKNLGKKLNLSGYNQMSPFLAADGITLYFSSNRPGGFGESDIWMTKRLDKTWQKWSEPVNLGQPINTEGSEAFFTLDAGGEYAYLTSSNGAFGASDIVRVKLLEKEKPDPVVLVTGNVYNAKTKLPLQAALTYNTLPDGTQAGTGLSNGTDGSFKIILPYDKNYSITASSDKFFAISENLNLDSLVKKGFKEIHRDLYLAPIEVGQVFRLNNVFFDFDKFSLKAASFVELNRLVKLLQDYPALIIEINAHTDNKGSDEYNMTLSENRAKSVLDYIISKGIAADRISSHGYGETKPEATNDTDEGRQTNRRVEFVIVKN